MRPHAGFACALISATAALESVPADAFRSVARGRVAVVDDFLARDVVAALRSDAEELWDAGLYSVATRVLAANAPQPRQREQITTPALRRRRRRGPRAADAEVAPHAPAQDEALVPPLELRVARRSLRWAC